MSDDVGRMDVRLPRGGVALRFTSDGCTLTETGLRRRWWWPWRKRMVTKTLAHEPFRPKPGDVVTLTQSGADYIVTVKDDVESAENVVLRWKR